MPIFMGLGGLALGGIKHLAFDLPAAGRKRQLASKTDLYSPWTGMHGGTVTDPSMLGTMMGTGIAGAQLGQGFKNADSNADFSKALQGISLANLTGGGSAGPSMAGMAGQSPTFGWNGGSMMPDNYQFGMQGNSPWHL